MRGMSMSEMMCMGNLKEYNMTGTYFNEIQNMLSFRVSKCSVGDCKNDQEIEEFLTQITIEPILWYYQYKIEPHDSNHTVENLMLIEKTFDDIVMEGSRTKKLITSIG